MWKWTPKLGFGQPGKPGHLNGLIGPNWIVALGFLHALCHWGVSQGILETEVSVAEKPSGSSEPGKREPNGLEEILRSTLHSSGQIRESLEDVEIAKAQLDRAHATAWPKGNATFLAAPIFEETGNALQSRSNLNRWGPYLRGGFEIVQPLLTFGQISNYQKAANHQIIAKSNLSEAKKLEVIQTAKEFYYGYLMAHELDRLVDNTVKFLEEAVETAESSMQSKSKTSVKPHDLFRLKTTIDDLKQKKLLALQSKETAEKAIVWISGSRFDHIPTVSLAAEKFEKKPLETYLDLARASRPEIKALAEGQEAHLALANAKQAQSYPTLFVGGALLYNWSPVRQKQSSFFAFDPFNQPWGGFGVGLRFDLEFARHSAEAAESRAEAMKLKVTESYALPGIELQVKKAYAELEQAVNGLEIALRRKTTAKKWFISSAMGWSIGVTPAKELMESLEGDALARRNFIETVYQHNIALGKLSQAVGTEVSELKYR